MDTDRKVPGPNDNKQGWMLFAHSGPLDLRAIRPEDIHVGDIVHVLGGINRSIGQTREPITVLWHSVMVAELCRFEHFDTELEALLHDAAEAADWGAPNRNGMSTWLPQSDKREDAGNAVVAGRGPDAPGRQRERNRGEDAGGPEQGAKAPAP